MLKSIWGTKTFKLAASTIVALWSAYFFGLGEEAVGLTEAGAGTVWALAEMTKRHAIAKGK